MTMRAVGQWSAILICGLAAVALAISQAFVIHDHVAMIHGHVTTPPPWPPAAQWAMALGFELAILAVTLAVAVVGWHRGLIVAEVFLVGVSILAGALVTYTGHVPAIVDTVSMALVPVQYVAVVLAAHALYGHYTAAGQSPAVVATVDHATAHPPAATPTPPRPRMAAPRPVANAGQLATDAIVASRAGVAPRTARRWRTTGDARYGQHMAEARAA